MLTAANINCGFWSQHLDNLLQYLVPVFDRNIQLQYLAPTSVYTEQLVLPIFGRSLTIDIWVMIFSGNICCKIKCQHYLGIGAANVWQWKRWKYLASNIVVKLSANITWELILPIFGSGLKGTIWVAISIKS